MENTILLLGDARQELQKIPAGSADLIFTSPPYAEKRKSTYGGIPAGQYVEWFMPIADELQQVLKPRGSFILNIKEGTHNGERQTYVMELAVALKKSGWLCCEEYLWHKTNCFPGRWPNRFRDAWERIIQFNLTSDYRMNPEYGDSTETNVLNGPTECNHRAHSAAFPIWLPAWFIDRFTEPGDTVLDPFMGSGTTVRASLERGRKAIGIEIKEEYYQATQCNMNVQQALPF